MSADVIGKAFTAENTEKKVEKKTRPRRRDFANGDTSPLKLLKYVIKRIKTTSRILHKLELEQMQLPPDERYCCKKMIKIRKENSLTCNESKSWRKYQIEYCSNPNARMVFKHFCEITNLRFLHIADMNRTNGIHYRYCLV